MYAKGLAFKLRYYWNIILTNYTAQTYQAEAPWLKLSAINTI